MDDDVKTKLQGESSLAAGCYSTKAENFNAVSQSILSDAMILQKNSTFMGFVFTSYMIQFGATKSHLTDRLLDEKAVYLSPDLPLAN